MTRLMSLSVNNIFYLFLFIFTSIGQLLIHIECFNPLFCVHCLYTLDLWKFHVLPNDTVQSTGIKSATLSHLTSASICFPLWLVSSVDGVCCNKMSASLCNVCMYVYPNALTSRPSLHHHHAMKSSAGPSPVYCMGKYHSPTEGTGRDTRQEFDWSLYQYTVCFICCQGHKATSLVEVIFLYILAY